ncbi:thiamine phosphate synthase [Corynebacterium uberis]|uniref:thiamine phosphate synthase n=1 Tax=Corynebacterium uberis TaxID=2883169 RepID=UPI001D0ABE1F|nr:thiamine phosphate synthase [Corynebacterium uberis]UDL77256.1 thiamine phosphate synthase [Corynebacterium uberis]UDL79540.1 thiamine phosphate synthase [Corynebacterium uberis]UDL81673.1 thiamine phosphate synthase [Corynebacterium uberis]UDL83882.1 thiamine phosphate synthase [Corynebacterium uberis]
MNNSLDLRCYLVTSRHPSRSHIAAVAAAAARGGAGVVQVRSKPTSVRDLAELARAVARAVFREAPNTRVLIDDRTDVAAALMAAGEHVHGVHLGQEDLPVGDARRVLGPQAIIGLTTGTADLIRAANTQAHLIDYVGCGPFRPTPTKDSGRPPIGVEGYPPLVALSQVPLVAIGDVTQADVPALAATGVAGVALCRELMNAADPAGTAASIVRSFACMPS